MTRGSARDLWPGQPTGREGQEGDATERDCWQRPRRHPSVVVRRL